LIFALFLKGDRDYSGQFFSYSDYHGDSFWGLFLLNAFFLPIARDLICLVRLDNCHWELHDFRQTGRIHNRLDAGDRPKTKAASRTAFR